MAETTPTRIRIEVRFIVKHNLNPQRQITYLDIHPFVTRSCFFFLGFPPVKF